MATDRYNAVKWAQAHGTPFNYTVALDNHEPWARNHREHVGVGYMFPIVRPDTSPDAVPVDTLSGIILPQVGDLKDWSKAAYLITDGETVRMFYVAGYSTADTVDSEPHVILHPVPVLDHLWGLGPRRLYHLRVVDPQPSGSGTVPDE